MNIYYIFFSVLGKTKNLLSFFCFSIAGNHSCYTVLLHERRGKLLNNFKHTTKHIYLRKISCLVVCSICGGMSMRKIQSNVTENKINKSVLFLWTNIPFSLDASTTEVTLKLVMIKTKCPNLHAKDDICFYEGLWNVNCIIHLVTLQVFFFLLVSTRFHFPSCLYL